MLTDKTKTEFEKYFITKIRHRDDIGERYWDQNLLDSLYTADLTLQLAYAIDFFDSVGIYINPTLRMPKEINKWAFIVDFKIYEDSLFKTRQEASEEAIKQANEIYNAQSKA